MKKLLLTTGLLLLFSGIFAQNLYNPEKIGCVKYVYKIAEKDSPQNKPLFSKKYKKNLFAAAINAIRCGKLLVYKGNNPFGQEFSEYMSEEQIYALLNKPPLDKNGNFKLKNLSFNQIKAYKIIEIKIFDKNGKLLNIRPIGLAPLTEQNKKLQPVFWIYLPDFYNVAKDITIKTRYCKKCSLADYLLNTKYDATTIEEHYVNFKKFNTPYIKPFPQTAFVPENNFWLNSDNIKYAKLSYYRVGNDDERNKPLFYPEKPLFGFQNLMSLIFNSEQIYGLNIYNPDPMLLGTGNEFQTLLPENEFLKNLKSGDTVINLANVREFLFIFVDFYNYYNQQILSVPLGIAPIIDKGKNLYKLAGFIYYPEFRKFASRQDILKTQCLTNINFDNFIRNKKFKALSLADSAYYKKYDVETEWQSYFDKLYVNLPAFWQKLPSPKPVNIHFIQSTATYYFPKITNFAKAEIVYTKITKKQKPEIFEPKTPERGYKSLFFILLEQIRYFGNIAYADKDFTKILTEDQILKKLGLTPSQLQDADSYGLKQNYFTDNPAMSEIEAIITKELWLYDSDGNLIQQRVLGLSPVRRYFKPSDIDKKYPVTEKLFWIKFSDYAEVFKHNNVTKLSPRRDYNYSEFFIRHKYQPEILQKQKISKKEALKIIENE